MESTLLPNIVNYLSSIDPFDRLGKQEQNALAAAIDILYLKQGKRLADEQIVEQGLYIVRTGAVEQYHTDGTLRARLADGDLFGFSQLYRSGECDYALVALENSLLYRIPKQVLLKLMQDNPAVRNHFSSKESVRLAHSSVQWAGEEMLYLKKVKEVMNRNVAKVHSHTSVQDAAQIMVDKHRSSAMVMDEDKLVGVVTDRDMTKRVIAKGLALNAPVSEIMTQNPQTIQSDALLLTAMEMMMLHNVRSLPVMEEGQVAGVLTATSLTEKSQVHAVFLISRIYRQESLTELVSMVPQRQAVFDALLSINASPAIIQQMMTLIADAFNKRLLQLAERDLGPAPMDYAWFVAGSQARQEMHLNSDQDNGIILAREANGEEQAYFQQLAQFVCHGLDACGYARCPGEMMARNDRWCVSLDQWQRNFRQWVVLPEPQSLLDITVFLDIRFLYGAQELVNKLHQTLITCVRGNQRFLSIMVANSLRVSPPLGMFRQFVLSKDGDNRQVLNIKQQAVNLVVELARIYALTACSLVPETSKRLAFAAEHGVISHASQQELQAALNFINQVRFHHQGEQIKQGKSLNNQIAPGELTAFERNHLKDAFRIIARYQEAAKQRYHAGGRLR
ncbi:cyclic nucleotide-binding protein [Serratia sp. S1B]|nr:cyclic nucleotide-binding protein [Serratia sp. S1B]